MAQSDRLNHSEQVAGWKHGEVAVVGLTGSIGGGKSTAAQSLARRGAMIIDADSVGHQVLNEPTVRTRLIARFGPGIVENPTSPDTPQAPISRRALGAIVFADPQARLDLESIVHPIMRERFAAQIASAAQSRSTRTIVLDAAILFEAGWDDLCDRVIYVDAPWAARLDRVERSRGWTKERLLARERAQSPAEEKKARADLVLDNSGDPDSLERSLDRLEAWLHAGASRTVATPRALTDSPGVSPASPPLLRSSDRESSPERDSTRSPFLECTRRL